MPTYKEDLRKVKNLQGAASQGNRMAADISGTATTLHDNIMEAVREDRGQRGVSQMATDVGNVGGQLVSDPNRIREFGGDTVDPMSIDRFTSAARGRNLSRLGEIATQETANQGTLTDIIGAGANQLKAMAQSKMAEAQQKATEAENLMDQLNFQEQTRQFNESLAEKQRQFDLNFGLTSSGSGGGTSIEDLMRVLREGGGSSEEALAADAAISSDPRIKPPEELTFWERLGGLFGGPDVSSLTKPVDFSGIGPIDLKKNVTEASSGGNVFGDLNLEIDPKTGRVKKKTK